MENETTATEASTYEQTTVVAEIFARLMADANKLLREQQEAMQRQMDASSNAMSLMLKDTMLNICASTGVAYETVMPMANNKAMALDSNGHTDDTEGGSTD